MGLDGEPVATESALANTVITVQVPDAKLWSPDSPFLYDLRAELFRIDDPVAAKLKKAEGPPEIRLVPTVDILAALGGVKDPEIGRDLVSLGMEGYAKVQKVCFYIGMAALAAALAASREQHTEQAACNCAAAECLLDQ